jgi:elongation factor Ts
VAENETLNDMIVHTTQITGEKITLRRFAVIEKTDGQVFGAHANDTK